MPNKSAKGSVFERHICERLSLWWTQNDKEPRSDIFWRTAQSGGRATTRSKKNKRTAGQHGDVCATDPIGQPLIDLFVVELKRGYNRYTVHDILDRPKDGAVPKYQEWFLKAEQTAKDAGTRSWFLIARRDRKEPLIFVPWKVFSVLSFGMDEPNPGVLLECGEMMVSISTLGEFLDRVSPEELVAAHSLWKKERKRA